MAGKFSLLKKGLTSIGKKLGLIEEKAASQAEHAAGHASGGQKTFSESGASNPSDPEAVDQTLSGVFEHNRRYGATSGPSRNFRGAATPSAPPPHTSSPTSPSRIKTPEQQRRYDEVLADMKARDAAKAAKPEEPETRGPRERDFVREMTEEQRSRREEILEKLRLNREADRRDRSRDLGREL